METQNRFSWWGIVWAIIAGGCMLLGIIFIVPAYIDARVDDRIRSSEIRAEIAKEANKYLVFDERGFVTNDPNKIYDDWVDSIAVGKVTEANESSTVVTIRFKKFLEIEPMLFNLRNSTRSIGYRISNHEWRFREVNIIVAMGTPEKDAADAKYLLQIFH